MELATTTEPKQTPSAAAAAAPLDLNDELPSSTSLTILTTEPNSNSLSVVHAFRNHLTLPALPPAEFPPGDFNYSGGADCVTCGLPVVVPEQMVVCDGCERGFHLDCTRIRGNTNKKKKQEVVDVKVVDDWMCAECVSNAVSCDRWPLGFKVEEATGNKSGSSNLLSINGEGDRRNDLPDSRKHSPGDNTFGGDRFGVPVSYLNLLHGENGSSFKEASHLTPCLKLNFGDRLLPVQKASSKFREVSLHSHTEELREGHQKRVKMQPQNPEEIHLEALREYILERQGKLDEAWSVELKQSRNSDKPHATYCSPDGNTFQSMTEVARYLGLMPKRGRKRTTDDAFPETGQQMSRRRKSSRLSAACGVAESKESLPQSLSKEDLSTSQTVGSGGKSGNNVNETGGDESNNLDDTLPIQLEDFFILSLGKIDLRPAYHSVDQIWPVGYKSCWHDKITGSVFVSEVSEGGDSGPTFIVRRCSCSALPIPIASTVLCRENQGQSDCKNEEKVVDHDVDYNFMRFLAESSPPGENDVLSCLSSSFNECQDLQKSDDVHLEALASCGRSDNVVWEDLIGDFSVVESSASSAWRGVSKKFIKICNEIYKEKGDVGFFCGHVAGGTFTSDVTHESCEVQFPPFAKFRGSMNDSEVPSIVQDDKQMQILSEFLVKWLDQERYGLDMEFVQKFVELLPGAAACSRYVVCNKRSSSTSYGILQTKRKDVRLTGYEETVHTLSRGQKSPKNQMGDDLLIKSPTFPPGKPISTRLPPQCVGNILEAHEFLFRFHGILELQEPLSFEELEEELIHPWRDAAGERMAPDACDISYALTKAHMSMLKALLSELQSRVSAVIDPNGDGDSKPKRGRKKDLDMWTTGKGAKFDLLPINELTWPEMVRRYILAFSDGGYDLLDISTRERAKIFRCLQGDGGVLCGSNSGVLAKEEDAKLLAGAIRRVFGSSGVDTDILYMEDTSDATSMNVGSSDFHVPEWVKVLEPVRKLPTNVGARIRNRINEALKLGPPEWAKIQLEWSISKGVYKGNASGPTKQAVIKVLADVSASSMLQKPDSQKPDRKLRKVFALVSEIVMMKCRSILRQSVADYQKDISRRTLIKSFVIDDEGSRTRPLDFRIIDLRLAAGAYGGSHEAFLEDVKELWKTRQITHADQINLVELAGQSSSNFESLYEQEVLTLFRRLLEYSRLESLTADSKKEVEELLSSMKEIPKASWEEGVCKVCDIDKDDDNVLLCDGCDAAYHRYCLNPPLAMIPGGNWYCPSCNIGEQAAGDAPEGSRGISQEAKVHVGKVAHDHLNSLAHVASIWEEREYWELSAEERLNVLKFICDEFLNSSLLRYHLDQSSKTSHDLIQKVCSLSAELKNLNSKEERLASRAGKARRSSKDLVGDVPVVKEFSSAAGTDDTFVRELHVRNDQQCCFGMFSDDISRPEGCLNDTGLTGGSENLHFAGPEDQAKSAQAADCRIGNGDSSTEIALSKNGRSCLKKKISSDICDVLTDEPEKPVESDHCTRFSAESDNHVMFSADMQGFSSPHSMLSNDNVPPLDGSKTQPDNLELTSVRKEIVLRQGTISSIERQLARLSLRKDFLGNDSFGRLYWGFSEVGTHRIVVNGIRELQDSERITLPRGPEDCYSVSGNSASCFADDQPTNKGSKASCPYVRDLYDANPSCCTWVSYQSDSEIHELVEYLKVNDPKEKTLVDSILDWQKLRFIGSRQSEIHAEKLKPEMACTRSEDCEKFVSSTLAATLLQTKYGAFSELETTEHLKSFKKAKATTKQKMFRCECLEPVWPSRHHCLFCHRTFFTIMEFEGHNNCNRNLVSSVSVTSRKCTDMIEQKGRRTENAQEASMEGVIKSQNDEACPFSFEAICSKFLIESSNKQLVGEIGLIGSNGIPYFVPHVASFHGDPALVLASPEDLGLQSDKHAPDQLAISEVEKITNDSLKCAITDIAGAPKTIDVKSVERTDQKSSSRALVGKTHHILRRLKIDLLDMEATLPEEGMRPYRASSRRRWAWRAFVKSAQTVSEMVQATIVLEDMIKTDYLKKKWWLWSSLSAAARISTLSHLAYRIYSLDAAIEYEKVPDSSRSLERNPDLPSQSVERNKPGRKPSTKKKESDA